MSSHLEIWRPSGRELITLSGDRVTVWLADQDRRTRAPDDARARSPAYLRVAGSIGGADMKLLQVTMGHASIMVTAHTYADLYDSDLDRVADALDGLGG